MTTTGTDKPDYMGLNDLGANIFRDSHYFLAPEGNRENEDYGHKSGTIISIIRTCIVSRQQNRPEPTRSAPLVRNEVINPIQSCNRMKYRIK